MKPCVTLFVMLAFCCANVYGAWFWDDETTTSVTSSTSLTSTTSSISTTSATSSTSPTSATSSTSPTSATSSISTTSATSSISTTSATSSISTTSATSSTSAETSSVVSVSATPKETSGGPHSSTKSTEESLNVKSTKALKGVPDTPVLETILITKFQYFVNDLSSTVGSVVPGESDTIKDNSTDDSDGGDWKTSLIIGLACGLFVIAASIVLVYVLRRKSKLGKKNGTIACTSKKDTTTYPLIMKAEEGSVEVKINSSQDPPNPGSI